jgi:peptidoglycan hydrolase CwlO-like protein
MLRILAPTRTVFAALAGGLLLAFACALLLVPLTSGPASAATLEQKQAAARDRIQQTSKAIEAGRADLESAQSEAADAAARESDLTGLLANGEQRSAELTGQLDRAEAALERSKERLARARKYLAQHLVAVYMNGGEPSTLDMALGAGSFDELTTGTEYLSAIEDTNERLMDRVAELRRELDGKVDGLGEAKQAIDQHNAALASARDQIASVRAEAESSAASLASANEAKAAQIDSLKGDIAGWQKQIDKQQEVSAEQAEEEVEQNLGGPYSIPTYIVMCESGGNYSAVNSSSGAGGAYQIMPSTWEAYGGKGLPQDASKAEQDRIAALIWADSGPGAWSCA